MTGPAPVRPLLRASDDPAARVLRAIRFHGPVSRADLARRTALSASTVGRAVTALGGAGAVSESHRFGPGPAGGRPASPLVMDPDGPVVVAMHVGLYESVVAVAELSARVLAVAPVVTPPGAEPGELAEVLVAAAHRLLDGVRGRRVVWAGIAGAFLQRDDGGVDHELLGWHDAPLAALVAEALGVPTSVAPHVEAIAAAETLVGVEDHSGTTLLVYGRESFGCAQVVDQAVQRPAAGPADLGSLRMEPTRYLGAAGHGLRAMASDSAVTAAAARAGRDGPDVDAIEALARGGDAVAEAVLDERALVLGRAVGMVVAVTRPDRVVLAGQAFTRHPRHLREVARGAAEVPLAGRPAELRVSRAGDRIQVDAAVAVALDRVWDDPPTILARS